MLLFSLWYDHPHRPTRDADLLAFGPSDIDTLIATFHEICAVVGEDGLVFDGAAIKGTEIRKSTGYGGVRINIPATLAAARIALQIDIGFGDAVTPGPQEVCERFPRSRQTPALWSAGCGRHLSGPPWGPNRRAVCRAINVNYIRHKFFGRAST